MSDTLDRLLSLPAEDLIRRRKRRNATKTYNRTARPERSKEELAEYIREHEFRSMAQLLKGRTCDDDPKPYDYQKAFGSWSAAMKAIWRDYKPEFDRKYVIRAVIEFGLWTREAYERAREDRPDILPSVYAIRREFGSWGIMKELAAGMSLQETLASYLSLKTKLGRKPTLEDCRRAGLILDKALTLYGGKKGLDKFVEVMEEKL